MEVLSEVRTINNSIWHYAFADITQGQFMNEGRQNIIGNRSNVLLALLLSMNIYDS